MEIGAPAIGFAAILTLACASLFSGVPAYESTGSRVNDLLRGNSNQIAAGRHLAQKALVVTEVAISLVLTVAAGLLLSSFWNLVHTSLGFDTQHVITFKNAFTDQQTQSSSSLAERLIELTSRLEAIPGVSSAAAVTSLPTQLVADLPFDVVGRSKNGQDATGDASYMPITPHYFDALRIPLLSRRSLSLTDTHGAAPVLLVNQQFVRTYFARENPIGRHIQIGAMMGPGYEDPVREIVGVVGDIKQAGLNVDTPATMYLPPAQIPDQLTRMATVYSA